jgi:2-amino-4-hydroxy-6-hydroxymethyldihydropteridine diphosphokinase
VSGVYIALGSNLGNRRANMAMALRMLPPLVRVEAVSPLYQSPPQPPSPPPPYFNAVCRVVTGLDPRPLLHHLKSIERLIGRLDAERWAPRPIDLDLVLYGDEVIDEEELVVPHPRLAERDFVLRPLLDLDHDLTEPGSGLRLADLYDNTSSAGLTLVGSPGWPSTPSL